MEGYGVGAAPGGVKGYERWWWWPGRRVTGQGEVGVVRT